MSTVWTPHRPDLFWNFLSNPNAWAGFLLIMLNALFGGCQRDKSPPPTTGRVSFTRVSSQNLAVEYFYWRLDTNYLEPYVTGPQWGGEGGESSLLGAKYFMVREHSSHITCHIFIFIHVYFCSFLLGLDHFVSPWTVQFETRCLARQRNLHSGHIVTCFMSRGKRDLLL